VLLALDILVFLVTIDQPSRQLFLASETLNLSASLRINSQTPESRLLSAVGERLWQF
jgi:hypothetical protein